MQYVVQANRHSVEVTRSQIGEFPSPFRRLLRLHDLVQTSGPTLTLSAISGIFISFFEVPPAKFGKFEPHGIVNVKAPLDDFEDMYQIVREVPQVEFVWEETNPGDFDIAYYVLHAG